VSIRAEIKAALLTAAGKLDERNGAPLVPNELAALCAQLLDMAVCVAKLAHMDVFTWSAFARSAYAGLPERARAARQRLS
jgi:hypothetical protein